MASVPAQVPADLFDQRHYLAVRQPLQQAETLPAWCYTSAEFHRREIEQVFMRVWNLVGRVDQIPTPGDYFSIDIGGESLIIVRENAEHIHAFANTCRHRGTRLVPASGHCRVFSCPYHSWAYALDGRLIATPGMEDTADFDRAANGLLEVALDIWAGFIFVNLSGAGETLAAYLGNLPEKLESYNFADVECVRRVEYEVACNWKLWVENALEDYHTPTVHRTSIGEQVTMREQTTTRTGMPFTWKARSRSRYCRKTTHRFRTSQVFAANRPKAPTSSFSTHRPSSPAPRIACGGISCCHGVQGEAPWSSQLVFPAPRWNAPTSSKKSRSIMSVGIDPFPRTMRSAKSNKRD